MDFPYVKDLMTELGNEQKIRLRKLLKLLSETIPIQNIDFTISSEDHNEFALPYDGLSDERNEIMNELIESYINQGYSDSDAKEQVKILLNL